jgi:hypothetical protein
VWRSVAQGTPGAVELRLLYLEFELERRLLAHERALKTFLLRSRGIIWTSDDPVKANFAEYPFYALGWIRARERTGAYNAPALLKDVED